MSKYFFTSESVTEGHPDKVANLISDSILDEYLKQDSNSRVAIDTFIFKNNVIVSGQISSKVKVYIDKNVIETMKIINQNE